MTGNDTLKGAGGWDSLRSGPNNDTLDGGTGDDDYVFNESAWGVDTITDPDTFGNWLVISSRANTGAIVVRLISSTKPEVKKGTSTVNWDGSGVNRVQIFGTDGNDRVYGNDEFNAVSMWGGEIPSPPVVATTSST